MIAASSTKTFLIVPGLFDSDADHWQSRWQERFNLSRVVQPDWSIPDIEVWSQTLERAVRQLPAGVILLAHSFGCLATVYAAARIRDRVAGALLVAPADPDKLNLPHAMPDRALPFRAILVGSRNDPWLTIANAWRWADRWESDFVDLGRAGHINSAAGYGDWPAGWALAQLLAGSRRSNQAARLQVVSRPHAKDLGQSVTEQSYAE